VGHGRDCQGRAVPGDPRWYVAHRPLYTKTNPYSVDIFVNCIYLSSKIPSFLTHEQIAAAGASRRLTVIVDVSCDTTNPNNPIPVYDINTTFDKPTVPVNVGYVLSLSYSSLPFN
jgi:hypothetical protein